MKYLFAILAFFPFLLTAQSLDVEARGNKVIIITRDTTPAGETIEVATWKAEPRKFLTEELEKVTKNLTEIENKVKRFQSEIKAQKSVQKDLQKAIKKLDAGLILETGIPGERTNAPAPETTPPPKPKKKPAQKAKPKKE